MSDNKAEILDFQINCGIIQMPGRKFPAIAIQGDTFVNIFKRLMRSKINIDENNTDEFYGEINDILSDLDNYIKLYELSCDKHNINLPY